MFGDLTPINQGLIQLSEVLNNYYIMLLEKGMPEHLAASLVVQLQHDIISPMMKPPETKGN